MSKNSEESFVKQRKPVCRCSNVHIYRFFYKISLSSSERCISGMLKKSLNNFCSILQRFLWKMSLYIIGDDVAGTSKCRNNNPKELGQIKFAKMALFFIAKRHMFAITNKLFAKNVHEKTDVFLHTLLYVLYVGPI